MGITVFLVDGRPAHAVDGLHVGFAERLARHPDPVGCVECGGPSPVGSALVSVRRMQGTAPDLGLSAWRRCGDCVDLLRHGVGALARDALSVHGVGPAEHAPLTVIRPTLRRLGVPRWHEQEPPREEFSLPVERWMFSASVVWADRFRDQVRRDLTRAA